MRRRSRYAFPPAPTHCIISRHKPRSNAAVVHPIQSARRIVSHRPALAMRLPSSRFVPSSPFCFVDPVQNARFPNVPYRPYCCGLSVCGFQGSCCRWKRPAPTLVGLCGSPEPFSVIQMSCPVGGFAFAFRFISLTVIIV